MSSQEWKQLCHKAWENGYEVLQIDRFDNIGDDRHIIRSCIENVFLNAPLRRKHFVLSSINIIYSHEKR